MPMIDLTYPKGALTPDARADAVERLTEALLRHEGAVDNEQTRVMSRAFVHELPHEHVFVAGRAVDRPTYRVLLTVPAGTLLHGPGPVGSASRRALCREVTEILLGAEGTPFSPADAARVYCLIHEVEDGFWGGMGTIFRIEDVVAFANPDAPQTEVAEQAREAISQAEPVGA
jgi:phenylpyruvate tautomerase PptA (4-oxalocrotonate tautomerase family)